MESALTARQALHDFCHAGTWKTEIDVLHWAMIESIKHKGLRRLFEDNDRRGLTADMVPRIEEILTLLNAARTVEAMDLPGFRLHPLKGDLKGFWSITVRANWRIVFRFVDGAALDVDFVDYH